MLATEQDVLDVQRIVSEERLNPRKVWAMPEGVTKEAILERGAWLAEVCKLEGWNLSLRQHVLLWGHRKRPESQLRERT